MINSHIHTQAVTAEPRVGAFFARLCMNRPFDRFDRLVQEAVLLSMRCFSMATLGVRRPDDLEALEQARLFTSMAVQLVSDHVKHYPVLENTSLGNRGIYSPMHYEVSGSMRTELGQDTVYAQAQSYVEQARRIADEVDSHDNERAKSIQLDLMSIADGGSTDIDEGEAQRHLAAFAEALTSKRKLFVVFSDGELN